MASQSERTFGSRLYNAEQMATHVSTFSGYVPLTPETQLPAFNDFITTLKDGNNSIAPAQSHYSIAVDDRQDQFKKSATSLTKTLSPLLAFIKAKFGKDSEQTREITRLVNEIRGADTSKLKRNEEGEFVSNSHRTYGSQTQNFANIIATVSSFSLDYNPTNPAITIPNLQRKLEDLNVANTKVTTTYGTLKPLTDNRIIYYETLSKRSQTIKESVKSQYGAQSSEYKLIKGYKI